MDSSALVKRYVLETGTEKINETYLEVLNGAATLHFSVWNIGEVLGALDAYYRRKWLAREDYQAARESFISETLRLIRLGAAEVAPVRSKWLAQSWALVEEYHIYQADALQIVAAKNMAVDQLLSGDQRLIEVSRKADINGIYLG